MTTYVLPCHIHEKTSEDASVSATYDGSHMIHGHTKVAAVPIDGFKQTTSPEGSITGKVRIIRHNPNYY